VGLLRAGSLTFLTRLGVFLLSLATNILLARGLGPAGRGVYALALLVSSIMFLIANLGIGAANVYYVGSRIMSAADAVAHAASLALILGGASCLVTFIVVRLFGSVLFPGVGTTEILIASLSIPPMLFVYFVQTVLQGLQRFVHFNLVFVLYNALQTILIALAILVLRAGPFGAVVAWTVSWIPAVLGTLVIARSATPITRGFATRHYRALFKFGAVAYLSNLTNFFNYRFDAFLVNAFAGVRDVGLYAVGYGMAETVWYVSQAAATVLAPQVARSDAAESDRITASTSRMVLGLTLVLSAALALIAPPAIRLLFGTPFAASVWAVWLLLPGVVALAVAKVLSSYLLGRNKLKVDLLAAVAGLVVTIGLDLALIPRYGFIGASIASSIAYAVALTVAAAWTVRHSSINVHELLLITPRDIRMVAGRLASMLRVPAPGPVRGDVPSDDESSVQNR